MMVVGLSYRLIPMMLPAAMPTGRRLYLSAILIESGLFALMAALLSESNLLPLAALLRGVFLRVEASARWPASFRRCASPPESVGTGWPTFT